MLLYVHDGILGYPPLCLLSLSLSLEDDIIHSSSTVTVQAPVPAPRIQGRHRYLQDLCKSTLQRETPETLRKGGIH